MPQTSPKNTAERSTFSVDNAASLVNISRPMPLADVVGSDQKPSDIQAQLNQIQGAQAVPLSSTAYSTAPIYRAPDAAVRQQSQPVSSQSVPSAQERSLATSLLQVNENQASVWFW